uniref:Uncharacterized protein n=1 Tax=Oryza meridionalis TaxID=40149 RepID=A0A0E0ES10_9ORYZ
MVELAMERSHSNAPPRTVAPRAGWSPLLAAAAVGSPVMHRQSSHRAASRPDSDRRAATHRSSAPS